MQLIFTLELRLHHIRAFTQLEDREPKTLQFLSQIYFEGVFPHTGE